MKKLEPINEMFGTSTVQRETITQQFDIIRIYFTDEGIGGTSQHINEIEAIRSAGPQDILEINVAGNPGGSADCIMTIINALIETPAHTICILSGTNSSAATMIPLVCSEVVVTPYTAMMCHSVSGGSYGTMANQERSAVFFSKMYSEFMADIYEDFLSTEEIQDLKNGLEIYLNSENIQERLERRKALLAEEDEEAGCEDPTCPRHEEEEPSTEGSVVEEQQ